MSDSERMHPRIAERRQRLGRLMLKDKPTETLPIKTHATTSLMRRIARDLFVRPIQKARHTIGWHINYLFDSRANEGRPASSRAPIGRGLSQRGGPNHRP